MLLAVATAAIIVGTGSTFAQQERERGNTPNQPSVQSGQTTAAPQQNRKTGESQAGQERRNEQRGQAGQQGRETTGQAPGGNAGTNQPTEQRGQRGEAGERSGQSTREPASGQNERNVRGKQERTTGQAAPAERRENAQGERREFVPGERGERRENVQGAPGERRENVQGERNEGRTTTEGREGGGSQTNVNVQLSQEQRIRIHDVIVKEHNAPRVGNVEFSLDVGTRVPRSVHLVTVPSSIVEIEPVWRGFDYFLVRDEIVIVNPRTMEIVAVIPA
jgi:hypothetical protein